MKIDEEIIKKWNSEYCLEKLNDNISIYELKRFIHLSLDEQAVLKLYNVFINGCGNNQYRSTDIVNCIIDGNISVLDYPFSGLLPLSIKIRNDNMKEILLELYKSNVKVCKDRKELYNLASCNLYYSLGLDELVFELIKEKADTWLKESLKHGDELWPIIYYLQGFGGEKNTEKAYRAIRLGYDKYKEISSCMENLLKFVNYVTNNNYTMDDVLKLEPLVTDFEKTDFDLFISRVIEKINKY